MDSHHKEPSPVKLLFRLIQFLHHISLSTKEPPKAFKREQQRLNRMVRPAHPTPELENVIQQASSAWAMTVTEGLNNHYKTQLDLVKTKILNLQLSASDWASSKNKALQWARRNFGQKLQQQTIKQFNDFLLELPHKQTTQIPNTNPIKTQEVRGPRDMLSNFYLCALKFEGILFRSSEHAYQYAKCLFFHNYKLAELVKATRSASEAKACVGRLGKDNPQWKNYKTGLMERILKAKFDQVKNFRDALLNSAPNHLIHPVPDLVCGEMPSRNN